MYKNKDDLIQFFHTHHPPKDVNVTIDILFEKWNERVNKLEKLYENRDSEKAFEPMCKGIVSFLYALFITNDRAVEEIDLHNWKEIAKSFIVQPVNTGERLTFIIEHPTQYHSFIQLNLLYKELIKKHAVHNIRKK